MEAPYNERIWGCLSSASLIGMKVTPDFRGAADLIFRRARKMDLKSVFLENTVDEIARLLLT